MVTLKHYNYLHYPYLNYDLDDEQIQFTATVGNALERLRQRNLKGDFSAKPVSIFYENLPVGFFVLDFGREKFGLTDNGSAVLLRSLSVSPAFQGRGIGRDAMNLIPDFLNKNFSEATEIVLAVNEKNTVAAALYEKCGYTLSLKTRIGRSGLQKIMLKYL